MIKNTSRCWTAVLALTLAPTAWGQALYEYRFQDEKGAPTLAGSGVVKGDLAPAGPHAGLASLVADTPTGTGHALRLPMDATGQQGPGLELPESKDKLQLTDPESAVTVAMWIKWAGPDKHPTSAQGLLSNAGGDQKQGWTFGVYHDGTLVLQMGGIGRRISKTTIPVDQWVHVAMTLEPARQLRFFVAGDPAGLDQGFHPARIKESPKAARLGNLDGQYLPANAILDDVRVYDRILSPEQIKALVTLPAKPAPERSTKP